MNIKERRPIPQPCMKLTPFSRLGYTFKLMEYRRLTCKELTVAAIVAALACVLFYSPIWAAGMDLLQAVVNDISGYSSVYPGWESMRQVMLKGFFPLWSDISVPPACIHAWGGALLYPLSLLTLPFDFIQINNFYFAGRIWLMGFFTYLFARKGLQMGPAGAAMAAVAFSFCGIAQKRLTTVEMNVPWLIPLFLLTLKEIVFRPRLSWLIVCGLVSALSLYAGHPIAAFYMFVMGALWFLYLWAQSGFGTKYIILLAGAAFISLFFSGLQLVPGIEGIAWFWTYHFKAPLTGSYSLTGLFSLALPWLLGSNKSGLAVTRLAPYLGAIPVFLFIFGLTRLTRLNKHGSFFAGYFLIFLGLSFAVPPFSTIGYFPLFNRLMNSVSAYPSLSLALALFSGASFQLACQSTVEARKTVNWSLGAIGATALISGYGWWLINSISQKPAGYIFLPSVNVARESLIGQSLFGIALFLALAFFLSWIPRRRRVAAAVIIALTFWGLMVDNLGWDHRDPHLLEKNKNSRAVEYVKNHLKSGCSIISNCDYVDPNMFMLSDIKSFLLVSPLLWKRHTEILFKLHDINPETEAGLNKLKKFAGKGAYLPLPLEYFGTVLSEALGIQYAFLCKLPLPSRGELIYNRDAVIYRNSSATCGGFLTGKWRILRSDNAVLEKLVNLKRAEKYTAFFSAEDPGVTEEKLPHKYPSGPVGKITIVAKASQKTSIKTKVRRESLLIWPRIYFPGWRAWVDNKEERILPANNLWQAIPVKAGEHRVILKFAPPGFAIALWCFLSTVACAIIVPFAFRIKKK